MIKHLVFLKIQWNAEKKGKEDIYTWSGSFFKLAAVRVNFLKKIDMVYESVCTKFRVSKVLRFGQRVRYRQTHTEKCTCKYKNIPYRLSASCGFDKFDVRKCNFACPVCKAEIVLKGIVN